VEKQEIKIYGIGEAAEANGLSITPLRKAK